jgi:hypothetical protein
VPTLLYASHIHGPSCVPAAHEKSIAMLAHKSATLKIGKADTFEDVKCPDKQGWLHYAFLHDSF